MTTRKHDSKLTRYDSPFSTPNPYAIFGYDILSEENQEYSPLLKLPGELRNKIYSFVADSGPAQAVPLHLICRQIYHEAKPFNFSLSECAVAAQNLSRKLRMKGLGPYRISSRV